MGSLEMQGQPLLLKCRPGQTQGASSAFAHGWTLHVECAAFLGAALL